MAHRWQIVKSLFLDAVPLGPDERRALLDRACAGDAALRAEVESLLEHESAPDRFLEPPDIAGAPDPPPDDPGTIGPYQTIAEIGRGGMGTVYLAVRADDAYQKRVAIKLVKRGMDSDEIVARFRHERQALARLDHPNIARIVDGGTAADGRPYLVMDHVDGVALDEYCDRARLTVDARLDLFRTVCAAVHYAHQNLVVHRDVKPDNILVTADGVPKLLDFGVAKLLSGDPREDSSEVTRPIHRRLSLSHASPEQVRGAAVTTATDVYSLGVVLYELLAGVRPHPTEGITTAEAAAAICEQEPVPPSQRVREAMGGRADQRERAGRLAAARQATPAALARTLSGDLDRIVMAALRKDPQRRYASVEQLAEDVRRFQRRLPVAARPDSLSYRLTTFLRRHRMGVAATAALLLALAGGVAAISWQAQEAERERQLADRRFNDVRRLANAFMFEMHDAIVDLPGSTAARELLVRRALEYVDALAAESADDRSLQMELAAAYQRVGDVQGNPTNANLGRLGEARESYRKAFAIAERLTSAEPEDADARALLARLHQRSADMLAFSGDVEAGIAAAREAAALYEQAREAAPGDPPAQLAAAIAFIKLADITGNPDFPNAGRAAQAWSSYQRALPLVERLPEGMPQRARYLGLLHERMGRMREAESAWDRAIEHYRLSLDYRTAFAAIETTHTDARRDVGIAHEKIGSVLRRTGDTSGALASLLTARAVYQQLHAADPANVNAGRTLAIGHEHVADLLLETRDLPGAEREYRAALTLATGLRQRTPDNQQIRRDVARLAFQLGTAVARRLGPGAPEACAWFRRSLEAARDSVGGPTEAMGRAIADALAPCAPAR